MKNECYMSIWLCISCEWVSFLPKIKFKKSGTKQLLIQFCYCEIGITI